MSSPVAQPQRTIADRYVVERELGRGGAAIVYLARDARYGRQVAVKVLRSDVASVVATERFLREVLITARLQHPHILAVLDSGTTDGLPFYVAPFLDGASLRSRLQREQQLPIEEALHVVREVADALDCAHSHGIVHRDIKPENVLFSFGHACVADFGIAQALEHAGGEQLTNSGMVLGTPEYMSPEQAAGEPHIDARSDVYSLACVVYEILAGVPPFAGATPGAIIAQRFAHPPRALKVYRAGLPARVEAAVLHALQVASADRTPSVREFMSELGVPLGTPLPSLRDDAEVAGSQDTLTGLPKRRHFRVQLESALARSQGSTEQCAVMFLDLDHFKEINDTNGHAAGDAVLRAVAERVNRVVSRSSTFCRLGGDEFVLLVPSIRSPEAVLPLAAAIRDSVVQPVKFADREIQVSTSIGIAIFPRDATTLDDLIHCADVALYAAKHEGRNAYVLYGPPNDQPAHPANRESI